MSTVPSDQLAEKLMFLPGAAGNTRLWQTVSDGLSHPGERKFFAWPGFGGVPYSALLQGLIPVDGHRVAAAPAHSPRLAAEIAEDLVQRLQDNRFPLRFPALPLSPRPGLLPLD